MLVSASEEVQPREGDVLRADHDRQEEVPQRRGDARDDEQEDHDRSVEREEAIVGLRVHDRLASREELEPHEEGEDAAGQESEADHRQVHQADSLVIERDEPRSDPAIGLQIVGVRVAVRVCCMPSYDRDVDCCHVRLLLLARDDAT